MAEPKSVNTRLLKVITDNLGVSQSEVGMSTRFNEDLGCDSLDLVEIVMGIEEEFFIEILEEEFVAQAPTFAQAVTFIENRIRG